LGRMPWVLPRSNRIPSRIPFFLVKRPFLQSSCLFPVSNLVSSLGRPTPARERIPVLRLSSMVFSSVLLLYPLFLRFSVRMLFTLMFCRTFSYDFPISFSSLLLFAVCFFVGAFDENGLSSFPSSPLIFFGPLPFGALESPFASRGAPPFATFSWLPGGTLSVDVHLRAVRRFRRSQPFLGFLSRAPLSCPGSVPRISRVLFFFDFPLFFSNPA